MPGRLGEVDRESEVFVDCPPFLDGDDTAFAVLMPDDSLNPLVKPGGLIYATKRRDPVVGDAVVLFFNDGKALVRAITRINDEKFCGVRVHADFTQNPPKISTENEEYRYDALAEIAVIAGTCRL